MPKDIRFYIYVSSAQKGGIIKGIGNEIFYSGSFISRKDIAFMAYMAAEAANINMNSIHTVKTFVDDSDFAAYTKDNIYSIQEAGIINGFEDNTFAPLDNTARAQAAKDYLYDL